MKGDSPRFLTACPYKALVGPCLLVIAMPALGSAGGADAHPQFRPILFSLAVLVVSAKAGASWPNGGVSRLAVAIGMMPRDEVGLIFAGIGTTLTLVGQPLLSPSLFSAVAGHVPGQNPLFILRRPGEQVA